MDEIGNNDRKDRKVYTANDLERAINIACTIKFGDGFSEMPEDSEVVEQVMKKFTKHSAIAVGIIGHVDHGKTTLTAAMHHAMANQGLDIMYVGTHEDFSSGYDKEAGMRLPRGLHDDIETALDKIMFDSSGHRSMRDITMLLPYENHMLEAPPMPYQDGNSNSTDPYTRRQKQGFGKAAKKIRNKQNTNFTQAKKKR